MSFTWPWQTAPKPAPTSPSPAGKIDYEQMMRDARLNAFASELGNVGAGISQATSRGLPWYQGFAGAPSGRGGGGGQLGMMAQIMKMKQIEAQQAEAARKAQMQQGGLSALNSMLAPQEVRDASEDEYEEGLIARRTNALNINPTVAKMALAQASAGDLPAAFKAIQQHAANRFEPVMQNDKVVGQRNIQTGEVTADPRGPAKPTKPHAIPAKIQLYNLWKSLPDKEKPDLMRILRANPYIDTGDSYVRPPPGSTNAPMSVIPKTLKPSEQLPYVASKSQAAKTGQETAAFNWNLYKLANAGLGTITKSNDLLKELKTSEAITGFGAEFLKDIERAKSWFGLESSNRKVADTEVLDAMMGGEVFGLIKSLGIGARGLDTPAEREFMRSVLTGKIDLNKNTLVRMAELRAKVGRRAVEKWNTKVKKGDLDSWFRASGIQREMFEIPGAVPSSPPRPGAATGAPNPKAVEDALKLYGGGR